MGLNALDLGVIVAYLAGVTLFGLHFRRKQQTLKELFSRRQCNSMVGDLALHCRGGDQHPYRHQRAGNGV